MVDSASVGQLFIAGVVPGLILAAMLGATTWYRAWRNDYPRMARASWGECARAFRESFWGLFLIVLVLGGIYSGLFTPTEAAAVAAVYAFFIAVFVYKELEARRRAGRAAQGRIHERDDPLHHHQRRGVFLAADLRADPAIDGRDG